MPNELRRTVTVIESPQLKTAGKRGIFPDYLSFAHIIFSGPGAEKQPITDTAAAMLRRQGLIEGRKPHYFVSAKVAAATDTGASYIRSKGLEKQKLKEFILQHLREFGPAPRVKLEELLFEMLPADLTEKKKRNKVKNLLTEMRARDKSIKRIGKGPKSKWTFFMENRLK